MNVHRTLNRRLVPLCCLLLLMGVAVGLARDALAVPTATTVERWVIAAGGGHTETPPYELDSTVGQALVGGASSAPYELCSGFWLSCGPPGFGYARVFLPVVLRND